MMRIMGSTSGKHYRVILVDLRTAKCIKIYIIRRLLQVSLDLRLTSLRELVATALLVVAAATPSVSRTRNYIYARARDTTITSCRYLKTHHKVSLARARAQ